MVVFFALEGCRVHLVYLLRRYRGMVLHPSARSRGAPYVGGWCRIAGRSESLVQPATRLLQGQQADESTTADLGSRRAVENAQRQLSHQPPSATFDQLAQRLPELRRLDSDPEPIGQASCVSFSPMERLLGGLGVKG
jgi:hypothetical protein